MDVLLSIKPKYANLIFSEKKRFEFRRNIFRNKSVNEVYVYVTSPEKKIVGKFLVAGIKIGSPKSVWEETKGYGGILRKEYNAYFKGSKIAYAIEIGDVLLFDEPIDPWKYDDNFKAPQSFVYLDRKVIDTLHLNATIKE
jgi:predicted transcriptional regulator